MSGEQKNKVKVKLLGQTYKLVGQEDTEYLQLVAQYVNTKMLEIQATYPQLDTTKIAVLSALNIADEYIKLKQLNEDLTRDNEALSTELITYKKETRNERH